MLIDALPPRGLTEEEVAEIEDEVDFLEDVFWRKGCISFVVRVDDVGYMGYQYTLFENEWKVSLAVDDSTIEADKVIDEHVDITIDIIDELYELDERKGNEFPYMPTTEV